MNEASTAGGRARAPASVAVQGLHKSFGVQPVLRGLDLHVRDGSLTAILAPSGSGKTTLLRLIAGFDNPDQGTITIGATTVGGNGHKLSPAARRVGYVPQEGALFPHLNVAANVAFGLARSARRDRVPELLELVGLPHLADRFPHQLSGGEQQRVALARALAPAPLVMLLDEPFSSLDASLRTNVRNEVTGILARTRTTTIIVTHDQEEALGIADQIVVLCDGMVGQAGTPAEVYARPVDAAVAEIVGAANFVSGTIRAGQAQTALGPLGVIDAAALAEGTTVTVLLRPEQIRLDAEDGPATYRGGVPGSVLRSEYHGYDATTIVALKDNNAVGPLRVRGYQGATLAPGTGVTLHAHGPVTAWAKPGPNTRNRPVSQ